MFNKINNSWDELLQDEFKKDYFKKLATYINHEYMTETIYPQYNDIFNAFKYTPYEKVKVVILGQDPYHGMGQAHGLAFSVNPGIPKPPSLRNIFKELKSDLGMQEPLHGCLEDWAKEGVLLLNTVLTVKKDEAASHRNQGWEVFTDKVIELINCKQTPVVFILWGNFAKDKKKLITNKIHHIVESVHPSPLSASRGFFGSSPFSKTNQFLVNNNISPINWEIK